MRNELMKQNGPNSPVKEEKRITDSVLNRVNTMMQHGQLVLPEGYSAPNALNSAWLTLQETKDRDRHPVLEACTRNSIANALLTMVIEGLNPLKNQVYFIAYGSQLVAQRSYFGDMMVAKRVNPDVADITSAVIYEGDKVRTRKEHGRTVIVEHEQDFSNIDNGKITGAYCTVTFRDGTEDTTIMTMPQIHKCWEKSQTWGKTKKSTPHDDTPDQMAQRTVTRRACKRIINASDDRTLLGRFVREMDMRAAAAERDEHIQERTNVINVEFEQTTPEAPEPPTPQALLEEPQFNPVPVPVPEEAVLFDADEMEEAYGPIDVDESTGEVMEPVAQTVPQTVRTQPASTPKMPDPATVEAPF